MAIPLGSYATNIKDIQQTFKKEGLVTIEATELPSPLNEKTERFREEAEKILQSVRNSKDSPLPLKLVLIDEGFGASIGLKPSDIFGLFGQPQIFQVLKSCGNLFMKK